MCFFFDCCCFRREWAMSVYDSIVTSTSISSTFQLSHTTHTFMLKISGGFTVDNNNNLTLHFTFYLAHTKCAQCTDTNTLAHTNVCSDDHTPMTFNSLSFVPQFEKSKLLSQNYPFVSSSSLSNAIKNETCITNNANSVQIYTFANASQNDIILIFTLMARV